MGVTKKTTIVAKIATKKRGRPVGSKNKVTEDSRPLVDKLQEALAIEMRTNQAMQKLFDQLKADSKPVNLLTFWQRVKLVFTGKY
jgi:hypothetical protein